MNTFLYLIMSLAIFLVAFPLLVLAIARKDYVHFKIWGTNLNIGVSRNWLALDCFPYTFACEYRMFLVPRLWKRLLHSGMGNRYNDKPGRYLITNRDGWAIAWGWSMRPFRITCQRKTEPLCRTL